MGIKKKRIENVSKMEEFFKGKDKRMREVGFLMGESNISLEKELLGHVDLKLYDCYGFVDYHNVQKNLHVKVKSLASALGKTPRAIQKNPNSETIQNGLRKIVYIIALLKEMLESEADNLIWIKAPNPDFGGLSPWDVIVKGEIDSVIDYLIDIKKGALT